MATDDQLLEALAAYQQQRAPTQPDAVTGEGTPALDEPATLFLLVRAMRRLRTQTAQNTQDIAAIKTRLGLV